MFSITVIVLLVAVLHLASRGQLTTSIWLTANLIDTLRALRLVRPNARKIGVTTRRKAMRESLKCWIVFIAIWQFEEWADWTVGWLPFYKTVRGIAFTAFLCTRAASSAQLYANLIVPVMKRYESPVDLTVLLIHSISTLIFHYTLSVPISMLQSTTFVARSTLQSIGSQAISSIRDSAIGYFSSRTSIGEIEPQAIQDAQVASLEKTVSDDASQNDLAVSPIAGNLDVQTHIEAGGAVSDPIIVLSPSPSPPPAQQVVLPVVTMRNTPDTPVKTPTKPPKVSGSSLIVPVAPPTLRRSPRRRQNVEEAARDATPIVDSQSGFFEEVTVGEDLAEKPSLYPRLEDLPVIRTAAAGSGHPDPPASAAEKPAARKPAPVKRPARKVLSSSVHDGKKATTSVDDGKKATASRSTTETASKIKALPKPAVTKRPLQSVPPRGPNITTTTMAKKATTATRAKIVPQPGTTTAPVRGRTTSAQSSRAGSTSRVPPRQEEVVSETQLPAVNDAVNQEPKTGDMPPPRSRKDPIPARQAPKATATTGKRRFMMDEPSDPAPKPKRRQLGPPVRLGSYTGSNTSV